MSLTPSEAAAVADLAESLYDFLPASSPWGTYTLGDAARDAGLAEFWAGGSKRPAIQAVLEGAVARHRDRLCPFVETVVTRGVMRRRGKDPVRRSEVEAVNTALLRLNFRVPNLVVEDFLASLAPDASTRSHPDSGPAISNAETDERRLRLGRLAELRDQFLELSAMADRQAAGLRLEVLLNDLFELFGLDPREPFRVVGEQIDGSFDLNHEVYLLEAKWQSEPTGLGDLAILRVKVEGKSAWTRGLFLSINGFTPDGVQALVAGKQQTCVLMDGADLFRVLNGDIALDDLLRLKVRRLAETGEPFVPISELK